jgi:hypothetical protein
MMPSVLRRPETAPLYPVPSLLYEEISKLKDHRFFADETKGHSRQAGG